MTFKIKLAAAGVTALAGAGTICPLCGGGVLAATAQVAVITQQVGDKATVKPHISGRTCGSCPVTARVSLKQLPGVLDRSVALSRCSSPPGSLALGRALDRECRARRPLAGSAGG